MKKILTTTVLALLAVSIATPILAQAVPSAYIDLSLMSKYVWRGQVITDDPVLQPAIGGNWLGFGLDIWGNADLTDYNGNKTELNEVDYTLNYTLSLVLVSLEGGVIHYSFPNTDAASTTELYLGAEVGVILSPSLYLYQDVDQIDGTYAEIGISHTVGDFDKAKLDLTADLGWGSGGYNEGYFGTDSSGFNNLAIAAELPWKPIPLLTVTPSVAYTTLLGDSKTTVETVGGKDNAWVFGLLAGVAFGGSSQ